MSAANRPKASPLAANAQGDQRDRLAGDGVQRIPFPSWQDGAS